MFRQWNRSAPLERLHTTYINRISNVYFKVKRNIEKIIIDQRKKLKNMFHLSFWFPSPILEIREP